MRVAVAALALLCLLGMTTPVLAQAETPTPTATATETPTITPTGTSTATPTNTGTPQPTVTVTSTPTATSIPANYTVALPGGGSVDIYRRADFGQIVTASAVMALITMTGVYMLYRIIERWIIH